MHSWSFIFSSTFAKLYNSSSKLSVVQLYAYNEFSTYNSCVKWFNCSLINSSLESSRKKSSSMWFTFHFHVDISGLLKSHFLMENQWKFHRTFRVPWSVCVFRINSGEDLRIMASWYPIASWITSVASFSTSEVGMSLLFAIITSCNSV